MLVDKETVIRSMVLQYHPSFDRVFGDPLFAFIFLPSDFDTRLSLVFCANSRSRGKEVNVEKVDLDYMTSVKHLRTPTQSLLDQLQTIKSMLSAETTALEFSEICRSLIVVKSKFKIGFVMGDKSLADNTFEPFEIRCRNLFIENDLQLLVGTLTDFITSTMFAETWVKDGNRQQIISKSPEFKSVWLWVRDDDFIVVTKMPMPEDNSLNEQYCLNWGGESRYNEKYMYTKTWNEMFSEIPGAQCQNSEVVFFIVGDMIRCICARNVNMFDGSWHSGKTGLPVIWCEPENDLQRRWCEVKISPEMRKLTSPYIPDCSRLREMVEITAQSINKQLLEIRPKILIFLCLSVLILKDHYNTNQILSMEFYCERSMFISDQLTGLLRKWTAYILGQKESYDSREKFKGREDSLFCFRVNTANNKKVAKNRQITWQFVPDNRKLVVYDTFSKWYDTSLERRDMPANSIDIL